VNEAVSDLHSDDFMLFEYRKTTFSSSPFQSPPSFDRTERMPTRCSMHNPTNSFLWLSALGHSV
jgi:hypothetical protein